MRRQAKDLQGKKDNPIKVEDRTNTVKTDINGSKKEYPSNGSAGPGCNVVREKENTITVDNKSIASNKEATTESAVDPTRQPSDGNNCSNEEKSKAAVPANQTQSNAIPNGSRILDENPVIENMVEAEATGPLSHSLTCSDTDILDTQNASSINSTAGPDVAMVWEEETAAKVPQGTSLAEMSHSTAQLMTDPMCKEECHINSSAGNGESMVCENENAAITDNTHPETQIPVSKKETFDILADTGATVTGASHLTTQPKTNIPESKTVPNDTMLEKSSHDKSCSQSEAPVKNHPQNLTKTEPEVTNNGGKATVNHGAIAAAAKKQNVKWQCDFCKTARFETYDEAVEHEKRCDNNVDWCMIHFDSGK